MIKRKKHREQTSKNSLFINDKSGKDFLPDLFYLIFSLWG